MIQSSLDKSELARLVGKLEKSPEVIKQAKRQALEQAAPKLKQLTGAEIGGTGKVQGWQEQYVGSKGGYAAVRPKSKTYTASTSKGKRYAVGAVTRAIESGHKFPSPSGKSERYKPRIRSGQQSVTGKHFYESAQEKAQAVATEAAEQVINALIGHLEG